jgi:hypothetical protein
MVDPCQTISDQVGSLFNCSNIGDYVRIRTPFLYPDGDVIDLFFRESDGTFALTDLGESMRWLRMQTVSPSRSPKQRQLAQDVALTHGVEIFKGMLTTRVDNMDELPSAVVRLGQAAVRIADLWFTFRSRAVESVTDEVQDLLEEKDIPFERGEKISGRSGRVWKPDFHVRHPKRSALVYVLASGSKAAARGIAEHVLASWYDLDHLKIGPQALRFVSLFDDTVDIWVPEDFRLLNDLSDVAHWSKPEEFIDLLAA